MIKKILDNPEYKKLVASQLKETMNFLINKDEEFSVTANINGISFSPELPEAIYKQLSTYSLFVLANYTYSTLQLDDNYIYFEAGFGEENFGSLVKIPYNAIFQIVLNDSIIFINSTATLSDFLTDEKQHEKSLNVFKKNPHNQEVLKNKD